ncbi:MAG: anthranilate synthase component I family protein [Bacteroidales bacterium]|nr:anthranilate synthase component I family protein [Bacteroidales bacterium]
MWKINTEIKEIKHKINIENIIHAIDKFDGTFLFTSDSKSFNNDLNIVGLNPVIKIKDNELTINSVKQKVKVLELIDDILNKNENTNLNTPVLLGYIGYDYKDEIEEKGLFKGLKKDIFPDLYFAIFEYYILFNTGTKNKCTIVKLDFPFTYDKININDVFNNSKLINVTNKKTYYKGTNLSKELYTNLVSKIKDYIKAGDIYQTNLTREINGYTEYSAIEIAWELYKSNIIEFGVISKINGNYLISTSPERFFQIINNKILTSPIKGTIQKTKYEQKNILQKNSLLKSTKDIAELAMIIDLLRNDIGKICKYNSINVKDFPILKELDNVYHLVADIEGELETRSFQDIIRAVFPGGSISGCPKIRACQIIEELEGQGRGPYTGSFGYICFNRNMDFNILIRTLFYNNNNISFNVGGGITLLSEPLMEYEETIHKAKNIYEAINMEEVDEERYCIE